MKKRGAGARIEEVSEAELRETTREMSLVVAVTVRDAIEEFHREHLTDAQMRQLNPLIRNAVFTALTAFERCGQSEAAKRFLLTQFRQVPDYWEPPELLTKF